MLGLRINFSNIMEQHPPFEGQNVRGFQKLIKLRVIFTKPVQLKLGIPQGIQGVFTDRMLMVSQVPEKESHLIALREETSNQRLRSFC